MLNQMQTIKVSEIYLNTWEIDHVDDNKQQLGKKKQKKERHVREGKFFILLWAKTTKKRAFSFLAQKE